MAGIESTLYDLHGLDTLAAQDTPIHRLDARAKVVTTFVFVAVVVSFGKYDISGLMPFFLYPVAMIALGNLPPRYLLMKLVAVSPFALVVGVFNPILDREVIAQIGQVPLTGGWISYASILLRFSLTVSAALILISTTGFGAACHALTQMKVPKALTLQFMLLYRYIFVLADEASRMSRAWTLRAGYANRMPVRVFVPLTGHLLIRALDRAQRIHMAMLSRGFDGEMRLRQPLRFGVADGLFVAGWAGFFVLARCFNLPQLLGAAVMGLLS